MNRGMKILSGIAAGMFLLGMAIPIAWADGGAACRGGSHTMGVDRHGMSGHGGMPSQVLRNLIKHQQDFGLTEDQVTKLKASLLTRAEHRSGLARMSRWRIGSSGHK